MSSTIRVVAKLAGVSTATASRVANGIDNVSVETRAKVLIAILRLPYCPNAHAAELGRAKAASTSKNNFMTIALTSGSEEIS
jgi:LacI family transcriptional regulator